MIRAVPSHIGKQMLRVVMQPPAPPDRDVKWFSEPALWFSVQATWTEDG